MTKSQKECCSSLSFRSASLNLICSEDGDYNAVTHWHDEDVPLQKHASEKESVSLTIRNEKERIDRLSGDS